MRPSRASRIGRLCSSAGMTTPCLYVMYVHMRVISAHFNCVLFRVSAQWALNRIYYYAVEDVAQIRPNIIRISSSSSAIVHG